MLMDTRMPSGLLFLEWLKSDEYLAIKNTELSANMRRHLENQIEWLSQAEEEILADSAGEAKEDSEASQVDQAINGEQMQGIALSLGPGRYCQMLWIDVDSAASS